MRRICWMRFQRTPARLSAMPHLVADARTVDPIGDSGKHSRDLRRGRNFSFAVREKRCSTSASRTDAKSPSSG